MARFRVVKPDGSTHGLARTHAEDLIRRGWAIEVEPRVIRMLSIPIHVDHIPERLPPVDVPGVHFEEPPYVTARGFGKEWTL